MVENILKGWYSVVRSKAALISSALILFICMLLYFPYPNNRLLEARSTFMSFPIRNPDGYIVLEIVGSIMFIIAMILLVNSIKKYHIRTIIIVLIGYALLPNFFIMLYQETVANDIYAISYDGNGNCTFDSVNQDLINGECGFILHNRSNESVSFELEFLDLYLWNDEVRSESLMNLAGAYSITIEANRKKPIHLKELLDVSEVPNHIEGGTSSRVHFKLIKGENTRIL